MGPFIFLAAPLENAGVWSLEWFSVVFSSNTILWPKNISFEKNLAQILKTTNTNLSRRWCYVQIFTNRLIKNAIVNDQKLRLRRGLFVEHVSEAAGVGERNQLKPETSVRVMGDQYQASQPISPNLISDNFVSSQKERRHCRKIRSEGEFVR